MTNSFSGFDATTFTKSDLRMSALSSGINSFSITAKKPPKSIEEQIDELDEKINQMRQQVLDSEHALRSLTDEIETKHELFVRQIENLKEQIDSANKEAENSFVIQQADEQAEYVRLHRKLEEEILSYQQKFDAAATNLEKQVAQRQEYAEIRNAWQITDMKRSLQLEVSKITEYNLNKTFGREGKAMTKRAKLRQVQMGLKNIQDEVSKLNMQVKEAQANYHVEQKELQNKIEMSQQNHKLMMQKLQTEQENREKDYIRHLNAVKMNIEGEKQRIDYESQASETKFTNLQSVLRTVQRQGAQQIQRQTADIQKLQSALQSAEASESRLEQSTRGSDMKMQDIRTKHAEWKTLADDIIEETNALKIENQKIVIELEKIEQNQKQQQKITRLSKRNFSHY